jgi:prepilin peptidase CpaA
MDLSVIDVAMLALFLAVAPIALWVAWSDVATMKIPNRAVLAAMAAFAVVGLAVLPFDAYLWRWAQFGIVLALGFVLNMARAMGAGDAKFGAAMALFIAPEHVGLFLMLLSAVVLASFVTHRTARAVPAVRGAFPTWESWHRTDFPMGLPLGGTLVAYLGLAALSVI